MASNKKKTGLLPEVDARNKNFLMRKTKTRPVKSKKGETKKMWSTLPPLDQGNTNSCTAHAGTQWLSAAPVVNLDYVEKPLTLYKKALKIDELPHSKNPEDDGTTIGAVFKVLRNEGYVSEYVWAGTWYQGDVSFTSEELVYTAIDYVLNTNPIVAGSAWIPSMFNDVNETEGFITFDLYQSGESGGHAYLLKGVDLDIDCPDGSKGAFRVLNSWGSGWGEDGEAWLAFSDAQALWQSWGDLVVATEVLKGTKTGGQADALDEITKLATEYAAQVNATARRNRMR